MPQEKIIIEFKSKGSPELIKALNNLAKAQREVKNVVASQEKVNKKLNASAIKMGVALKQQGKSFKDLGLSTKIVTRAFKGHTASLEKMRLAYKKAGLSQKQLNDSTLLGVRNNRLLANSFATLRSKLLLASFAATIVATTIGRVFKAASEQQQAEIKLSSALGRTSKALLEHASAMQQVTRFGDEVVINAQAMIASFIKDEDTIKSLTEATLDLAAAKGMDLTAAADLVAKSVGSSTNALARYGIAATGAAKSTERAESVVRNISVLYGGQAKAQAESYAGTLDGMVNAVGDAAEAIGDLLAPIVISFSVTIKNLANGIEFLSDELSGLTASAFNFFFGINNLSDATADYSGNLAKFQKGLSDLTFEELGEQAKVINEMFGDSVEVTSNYSDELSKLIAPISAVADNTRAVNDGTGDLIAATESIANAISMQSSEEERLELLEREKLTRMAFAQELFAKTSSSQKNATKDMIDWVKSNKEAFETEEAHADVLKMLEAQYNKTGESALKGAMAVVSSANSAISAIEANGNAIANANKKEELSHAKTQRQKDVIEKKYAKQAEDRAKKLQGWKIASAVSNVALGITQTWRDPTLPVWAKAIAIAAQATAGYAQVQTIRGQEFEHGGLIGGRRHSQGGTMIEAEQGEFIMNRSAVESVGMENLNAMNAGGGGGSVTVNVSGNVLSQDFVEGELAENIKEAVRRGTDFGIG